MSEPRFVGPQGKGRMRKHKAQQTINTELRRDEYQKMLKDVGEADLKRAEDEKQELLDDLS